MVITKHFATHGKKYRRSLIKYILNPEKTDKLKLISDFGMSNYLDFPTYEETVDMYHANFLNNDNLYDSRNDRQERRQQKIYAHHLIQSFSPDDKLTPEEINRIGYKTINELTGGQFRFIVATHIDQEHVHNHILINSVDLNSDKKLRWDYAKERNLRMISDRISKMAGAKIIKNRYSHRDYEVYKKTNHKFELKQRLYFLMQQSTSFEDFLEKAGRLQLKIDFTGKHSRFLMTDKDMKQVIRGNKLSKRDLYDENFFRTEFAKRDIESRLDFLLPLSESIEDFQTKASQLGLTVDMKVKNVTFTLEENGHRISLSHKKINDKKLYDVQFFQDYFEKPQIIAELDNLQEAYQTFRAKENQDKAKLDEISEAYGAFKQKRDTIHDFEVELADNQIERLVDDGIYIKVSFGVKQSGTIFIPNYQLDIFEEDYQKKYKVYIRETSSYIVYNKENSEKNRSIKGRTLIRQLTNDSQNLPYRKRVTLETLKEKVEKINLLMEIHTPNQTFLETKDQLVQEIATLDMKIEEIQEKIATLNKMAEVFINLESDNKEGKRLARYNLTKTNIPLTIKVDQVEREIEQLQISLTERLDEYEGKVSELEEFVQMLNTLELPPTDRDHLDRNRLAF